MPPPMPSVRLPLTTLLVRVIPWLSQIPPPPSPVQHSDWSRSPETRFLLMVRWSARVRPWLTYSPPPAPPPVAAPVAMVMVLSLIEVPWIVVLAETEIPPPVPEKPSGTTREFPDTEPPSIDTEPSLTSMPPPAREAVLPLAAVRVNCTPPSAYNPPPSADAVLPVIWTSLADSAPCASIPPPFVSALFHRIRTDCSRSATSLSAS